VATDEVVLVEIAVDAAGAASGQTYTYSLPAALRDVEPGEPVIVDFGRRQALGIVLGPAQPSADFEARPVRARVRSDGPLLPPLQLALVRWIADHYLAPLPVVVRACLPPGTLERLDMVARPAGPGTRPGPGGDDPLVADLLARVEAGAPDGSPVRSLPTPDGRPALLRRLRSLDAQGLVVLEWQLRPATSAPRYERRVELLPAGRDALGTIAAGGRPGGRVLGPRQQALLADLGAGTTGHDTEAVPLVARHGAAALRGLERRGLVGTWLAERPRRPLEGRPPGPRGARPADAPLTNEQARAVETLAAAVGSRTSEVFLLEGATAAGKTAVYAEAIRAALVLGRGALVLVPEVAHAVPLVDRLQRELAIEVAVLHGALGEGERGDEWRRIRAGRINVVVGTRIAVLAPLADPGIIIVDEEHEAAYKSDRTPRLQARDVAVVLGRTASCPVVLGSATPDVATVGRVREGSVRRLVLAERPAGGRPLVEVVDLRAELAAGNRNLISRQLAAALRALDTTSGDRAILVINRRGSATVVLCRDCGYVQVCPECRLPLVYHAGPDVLRCHHCGASAPTADRCPACESPRIRYLGGGTERLEREVREQFGGLRVDRLDRDVVERRGGAERVLDALRDGAIDVLVGTALVAKAIDVPEVTLVGVVSADIALNLPDARAAERTYQLLVQAIGRAGRGDRPGRAFIQTYQPDHPAVRAAADGEAEAFYETELAARRAFEAPPFGSLVKLTVGMEDRGAAEMEARRFAGVLRERAAASESEAGIRQASVLGPVPAYVPRRAGRWRFHVVLRGRDPVALLGVDPGPPWSVDVDPESVL
jgi:primosomal protein N' (replication factor Y)